MDICNRNGLQVDALTTIDATEVMEIIFLVIILEDRSALLLCANASKTCYVPFTGQSGKEAPPSPTSQTTWTT